MSRIIYTVQLGDSLYSIAKSFNVNMEAIKSANLLDNAFVYPGQKLIIPTEYYKVQSGDTLYKVAKKFNTTVESIIKLNNLSNQALTIGQPLVIPLYSEIVVTVPLADVRKGAGSNFPIVAKMNQNAHLPLVDAKDDWYKVKLYDGNLGWISNTVSKLNVYSGEKPIAVTLGFYTLEEGPTLPSSYEDFVSHTEDISELGLFMYRLNQNNPVQIEKFGEFDDDSVRNLVAIAHRNNVKIMPVVHNLLYKKGETKISKDLVKTMTSTKQNRSTFINNIINLIERFNFDGVNIDIEDVYIEDSNNLSAFYTELGKALDAKGYLLSSSVPSRYTDKPVNPFSNPFNYAVIGSAVDEFVAMLYNEHGWPGSGPGPVVSIGWMEQVLKYAISKMPREKIVAAVSVFGFDFNLTTKRNTYVTYGMAMNLAKKYNKEVIFDKKTQTPTFAYVDEKGNNHEVWFENEESILAKYRLAYKLGIRGVALWRLGLEDQKIWDMLGRDVIVKKV